MNSTGWLSGVWPPAHWRHYLLMVSLVAIAYALSARLGMSLAFMPARVTTVWPPSGISLAALLRFGYRLWPGIYIGTVAAHLLAKEPLLVAATIAAGNTLQALTAAYLLRHWGDTGQVVSTVREGFALVGAGALGTVIAATVGTLSLAVGGLISWQRFEVTWLVWWAGDVMGILLFAPFLLVLLSRESYEILRGRLMESGLLLTSVLGMSLLVFTVNGNTTIAFPYMLFPFIAWAALRFTQLGVVVAALVITGAATWTTFAGLGPFTGGVSRESALLELQVFIFVMTVTGLILAAAINERAMVTKALVRQTQQLERLEGQLKDANRRITDILASLLKNDSGRRGPH